MEKVLVFFFIFIAGIVQGCFKFTEKCECSPPEAMSPKFVKDYFEKRDNVSYNAFEFTTNYFIFPNCTNLLYECENGDLHINTVTEPEKAADVNELASKDFWCDATSGKWRAIIKQGTADNILTAGCFMPTENLIREERP